TEQQAEEGIRPGIDRVQTGIEATRGRQQLARAEAQETVARAALNTMMGLGPEAAVGELPALSLGDPPAENDGLIEQALEARAELEVVRGLRDQYRQEARLTRAQGRPDLAPQLRGGSLIRGVQDTGVGLGITWPFLDHGSRRARVRQSEEAANAQGARLQAARNLVRQETVQALARVRATGAVVRDYQGGVLEQSRRVLEARRTGFQAGLTTVLELLEAQRTYRGVLAEYANALADHAEARAELERATGAVPADLLPTPGEKRSPR
ncbi:MAG: transporter, partial [Armatimonadetes bacterium]|nr:transporter [Armatimonadota bacterium]